MELLKLFFELILYTIIAILAIPFILIVLLFVFLAKTYESIWKSLKR